MPTPTFDHRLETVVEDLISRSSGKYSADLVREVVADIAHDFDDARVQDYFEVLVAKEARDRLRQVATS